ncbi:DUF1802 family protein [Xylanibacillus composti]|uniref:DUF1802 family protein n=1 Tax=Xylanibacillus composti TaxID=1572762 RepID=A0A8J4H6Z4_9BACL|nr:DUF1802 family protein [Xylanibacillus composti]MDT9724754.1 DUF1802 family protein [Xylanibacillus composti]GIQ69893.1 hypothetical protein XYCOK13_27170 [Xylanibacillus composti]
MQMPRIALKEWAAAVKALEQGKQMLLMRKGGIAEETRDFQLQSRYFSLFPTYEHQKQHLIKEADRHILDATLEEWPKDESRWPITIVAEAVEDLLIHDANELQKLQDEHIWTESFAEERLRWKKTQPLHVLVLRAHRLREPIFLPMLEQYGGCKSWIELAGELPESVETEPVLDDAEFNKRLDRIRRAVGKI